MRKWRPGPKCIYVIPEVQGSIDELKIICSRILPLRISIGQEDMVVMLGDYIGSGKNSSEVINFILEMKKKYNNNFICLMGYQENLLLKAIKDPVYYFEWLQYTGSNIINSYMNNKLNNIILPFNRLKDIIPNSHLDFIESLPIYCDLDDYIFMHGAIQVTHLNSMEDYSVSGINASKYIKNIIINKQFVSKSDKVYITSNNYKSNKPFIHCKYFMLGGAYPNKITLFELNSLSCAMVKHNKSQIYKFNYKILE